MYSKQEAKQLKKAFWISFGLYMRPIPGAGGEPVNWLNYKTGKKHLYFRMDADSREASVSIECRHPEPHRQKECFAQFQALKGMLEETTGRSWDWELYRTDEDGQMVSRVRAKLEGVNIYNKPDWPAIISFFKPLMIGLDGFWEMVKEGF